MAGKRTKTKTKTKIKAKASKAKADNKKSEEGEARIEIQAPEPKVSSKVYRVSEYGLKDPRRPYYLRKNPWYLIMFIWIALGLLAYGLFKMIEGMESGWIQESIDYVTGEKKGTETDKNDGTWVKANGKLTRRAKVAIAVGFGFLLVFVLLFVFVLRPRLLSAKGSVGASQVQQAAPPPPPPPDADATPSSKVIVNKAPDWLKKALADINTGKFVIEEAKEEGKRVVLHKYTGPEGNEVWNEIGSFDWSSVPTRVAAYELVGKKNKEIKEGQEKIKNWKK